MRIDARTASSENPLNNRPSHSLAFCPSVQRRGEVVNRNKGTEREGGEDVGLAFVAIYFVFILLVLEISAELLVISGLDREIARFQAVSMLTATGYTTMEAELILRHPLRRKIAMFLILFGVFSLAVLISGFSGILAQSFRIPQLSIVTGFFALLLVFVKIGRVQRRLTRRFHQHLTRDFQLHELPIEEVLYTCEDDLLTRIDIGPDSRWKGKRGDELVSKDEDLLLLFIERGEKKQRCGTKSLTVQEGDRLYIYGNKTTIEQKFAHELKQAAAAADDERRLAEMR